MSSLLISEAIHSIPSQLRQNSRILTGATQRTARLHGADRVEYNFDSQPVISIELPANSYYDMAYSSLQFNVEADNGAELLVGAASLFRKILIRGSDGRILCESDCVDLLNSALVDFTINSTQQNTGLAITALTGDGTAGVARRTFTTANNKKSCAIQPLLELCRYDRYLPCHLLGKLTIEFYLQDPRICFKHTGAVGYKITNVLYRCDKVEFTAEVENLMMQAWAADKLRFHFKYWKSTTFSQIDQKARLTIRNSDHSVNALLVVPRLASKTVAQNANSYERVFGNIEEISVAAGNNIIERINCRYGAGPAFFELQKMLDFSENTTVDPRTWAGDGTGVDADKGTKFALGLNLETVTNHGDAISGYMGRGDIVVEFLRTVAPAEPIVYTCFLLVDATICSSQNEGTRVV